MAELVQITKALHLLFAALWGGGSIYHGTILMGSFMSRHAAPRRDWWVESKVGPYFGLTSLLTLVFGLWTYVLVGADGYSSGENAVLGIGMLAGTVGVVVGYAGHLPTMVGLAKAVAVGDEARIAKLEHREHVLDLVSLVAVAVAIVTMSTFRLF
ncbi:MAG: hypothetical protein ACPGQL_07360 [Thermoplasmatota archaeon]